MKAPQLTLYVAQARAQQLLLEALGACACAAADRRRVLRCHCHTGAVVIETRPQSAPPEPPRSTP